MNLLFLSGEGFEEDQVASLATAGVVWFDDQVAAFGRPGSSCVAEARSLSLSSCRDLTNDCELRLGGSSMSKLSCFSSLVAVVVLGDAAAPTELLGIFESPLLLSFGGEPILSSLALSSSSLEFLRNSRRACRSFASATEERGNVPRLCCEGTLSAVLSVALLLPLLLLPLSPLLLLLRPVLPVLVASAAVEAAFKAELVKADAPNRLLRGASSGDSSTSELSLK